MLKEECWLFKSDKIGWRLPLKRKVDACDMKGLCLSVIKKD
jgi:hypothetical protein